MSSPKLLLAAATLLSATALPLAAQLPATAPTSTPAPEATTAPLTATSVTTAYTRPQRAQVSYVGGELDVRAENSSLNDILFEISRATGMKIHGGVNDQRVFGHYGPAAPSDVLATLLFGTGTNMLLKEDDGLGPVELVLTPRTGGVTPPSPSAPSYSSDSLTPPPQPSVMGRGGLRQPPVQQRPGDGAGPPGGTPPAGNPPLNNPLGSPDNTTNTVSTMPTTNSVPTDALPTPSTTTETQQGIVDSPNPPATGTTTATSPNGVSTPEQIYQQLLKLQQSTSGSTSTTTTPPQ
ncbi:hypothetical protein SAMN05421819_0157 [Bryocella elongata]|uniref:Uncharacterized protein n=1 Tax=Bryocella elongata TaxID=863522 RepID=A0A1H5SD51_9BACT|nr:hypothetical protein [Bryocella elongata]SEF48546.1 hypothetical protein SAMN05421819_0157 [Bryocella elongata]